MLVNLICSVASSSVYKPIIVQFRNMFIEATDPSNMRTGVSNLRLYVIVKYNMYE